MVQRLRKHCSIFIAPNAKHKGINITTFIWSILKYQICDMYYE